jgi:uncharacterized protein YceK
MNTDQGKHLGLWCATAVLAGTLTLSGCSSATTKSEEKEPAYGGGASETTDPAKVGSLQEQWGVEILGIQTSAAGYMLDFRYRVLDAEKAAPLLDRRIKPKPYIIVEKDNAKLQVPVTSKLGALRQTTFNVRANRNYFVLFSNPSRHVQPGDKVTVVIGDFVAQHLEVL